MCQEGSDQSDDGRNKRRGTISSARFNLLSSMVGGGSLSLPLAFHQTGNLLVAPVLLVVMALLAQQSILFLVKAGVYSTSKEHDDGARGDDGDVIMTGSAPRNNGSAISERKGNASYEDAASKAFGPKARVFSMFLVCACCFAATVGYAVLLRDMLEPIVDAIVPPPDGAGGGPTFARNAAMLVVVCCVSPLTTWRDLTALKDVGAASMASVLTVGLCVAYRSVECQLGSAGASNGHEEAGEHDDNLRAFPPSTKQLVDAIPLFVSSYICHFNVLPIHNELRCPTSDRVKRWVRTSIWPATLYYYVIGFTGSLFAKCTPSGSVQGNILLDFDEDDPLLLLGRLCLAMTITLAFPMLVIPARDILVRSLLGTRVGRRLFAAKGQQLLLQGDGASDLPDDPIPNELTTVEFEPMEISQPGGNLEEPLLALESRRGELAEDSDEFVENASVSSRGHLRGETESKAARTIVALLVFWSAAGLACSVKSIDVVWDLVGSSFSILLAFLIPCGAYLKLARMRGSGDARRGQGMGFKQWKASRAVAWGMLMLFFPLMFISTANACYNSFFGG